MSVMQGPNDGTADLTDATRRWLTDEAAKTQAWLDANQRPDDRVPVRDDTEADDSDRGASDDHLTTTLVAGYQTETDHDRPYFFRTNADADGS